jgi:gamma-glutamylcyclotransferase (GGCT)/AIG2-like uncharacterized protein YtfP
MRFFFYGTLMGDSAHPLAGDVHERLVALGRAEVAGRLHAIPDPLGWYPAMVAGAGTVHGALYTAGPGFGASDLARLDAYEGADYRREVLMVAGGEAQAYVWHADLPEGAIPLPHGDFARFLREGGHKAYDGP